MKQYAQRIVVLFLAALMLLTVFLPAPSAVAEAAEVTEEDIKDLKDEISANAALIKEVEAKLKEVRAEKSAAKKEKTLLDEKITLLSDQIEATDAAIENYNTLIGIKESEIADMEAKEDAQYALFCQQVRDMEETGNVSYFSILFSASTFSELLDYAMLISEVMEYHNGVIDALIATQTALAEAKTELEGERAEQQALKEEQERNKAELEAQEAEVDRLIKKINATENEYEHELDVYEDAAKSLDKELDAAEKKYKAQLEALAADNGDWYWPLPGRYYISSSFAPRKHPITGKYSHHTGNDIPAPGGTEIHAAKGGVVTDVGYNSVYGNYILISHGGGYATFYAHLKKKAIVKEGATVKKGQVIGYVGTTGWSTGNHLHLELRVDGVRKDALELYPKLKGKFTYKY